MHDAVKNIKAVILAGGSGTRLWPISREQLPKQFLSIDGNHSLLESTIERLNPLIVRNDVLVVTKKDYARGEAYRALCQYQTLLEPQGRNTAPAIALAAAWLARNGDDPVMIVLPADHVIKDPSRFQSALVHAVHAARKGKLVIFGIKPTRPDTGFGYVNVGARFEDNIFAVSRFAEKPDIETAQRFLASGDSYWNSGMFAWCASTILNEIEIHLPDVFNVLTDIRKAWAGGMDQEAAVAKYFEQMPSISIDYGVLEKTKNVVLIPCDIGWSDIGSWDAVHEVSEKDRNGNVMQGNVIALDCKNTLIQGDRRLLAAIGVNNLNIIETTDAVLITERGESQRVREIVDILKRNNAKEHVAHMNVLRPWGSYTVLESGPNFKMKRISVDPGHRLSMQRHRHRSEHWVVVAGVATVTRGDEIIEIKENQSTYIPIGVKHRLENRGMDALEIIEVQVGEYLEEDDIERFDDEYGR